MDLLDACLTHGEWKRAARAGKSWLDDLGDIEEEDSDS